MNADQIIVMEHGRIIERGTREQLIAQKGDYAQMWESQQQNALDAET
ncbi:hypothetical protein SDC9_180397 [bioreactor metagenome]|uniref:ABC transporter ATP-binding protein n=1 Tax=bioreactor metagenome TaxID=1076179 RepID=A0A645H9G0_9ZZZZ